MTRRAPRLVSTVSRMNASVDRADQASSGFAHTTRTCAISKRSILICMARQRGYRAGTRVDPKALAEFRAGIRKRYTDEQILDQLRDCAKALGRSPPCEFERHDGTTVHPQTVIERFGSWNGAKREAGLVPRRFATKEASAVPPAAR